MTLEEYLNLIPSANRTQPNFISALTANLDVYIRVQELLLEAADSAYDIDYAIGDQLDVDGLWVGVSREVNVPITGVYFSWDDEISTGWDYGVWQPNSGATEVTILPDDVYRLLIKFKIAANNWDGTTAGAYAIWEVLFPDYVFLIQDNQDMSYNLAILGSILDSLTLALIRGGAIALKPEGVRIDGYYIPANDGPVFAWDVENDLLEGWDSGSWAEELPPT